MSTLGKRLAIFSVACVFFTAASAVYPVQTFTASVYRMAALSFFGGLSIGFVLSYAYIEWHMTRVMNGR